eukprot:GSChrysophyteH1.ASY1.ANO1.1845.1 assembled CDS
MGLFMTYIIVILCCLKCAGCSDIVSLRKRHLETAVPKISGVLLTTAKDGAVFERSIKSALQHLVDVDKFYVITPSQEELSRKYESLGDRVIFVAEQKFNFTGELVADTMLKAVKDHGEYPLDNGKSPFERTLWGKMGWFLQQLLKIYAGKILDLGDYVLLDGDCVWFKDVKFIADDQPNGSSGPHTYNYATSTQYHGPYVASSERISGVKTFKNNDHWRSGVVHHMVLVKEVLEDLFAKSEELHKLPFWHVMLKESALEMTCRAPRSAICGAGSTLSEYEMYFNYARSVYPTTVHLRPLLWANGPMPGLLYWPDPADPIPLLSSDSPKHKWLGHRQNEVLEVYERQIAADSIAGFHYVGYHGYAKRRYFELWADDVATLCDGAPEPFNTTCSYRGLDRIEVRPDRTPEDWFRGCGCFMARNANGI